MGLFSNKKNLSVLSVIFASAGFLATAGLYFSSSGVLSSRISALERRVYHDEFVEINDVIAIYSGAYTQNEVVAPGVRNLLREGYEIYKESISANGKISIDDTISAEKLTTIGQYLTAIDMTNEKQISFTHLKADEESVQGVGQIDSVLFVVLVISQMLSIGCMIRLLYIP